MTSISRIGDKGSCVEHTEFSAEYLERISIFNASVHTLRHTMAVHHIAQGTSLQVIQEKLGISLEATEKYVSLSKQTARKAL